MRASRAKKESVDIDLSFLDSDEDIAAFRTDSPQQIKKRAPAARSNGSSRAQASASRTAPVHHDQKATDTEEDSEQEAASSHAASSDELPPSRATRARPIRNAPKVAPRKSARSRAPASPPTRSSRQRRPLLTNHSDSDSAEQDFPPASSSRRLFKQREMRDFVVDSDDDDAQPSAARPASRSTRVTRASSSSRRAAPRTATRKRTQPTWRRTGSDDDDNSDDQQDEDDQDEDDEDTDEEEEDEDHPESSVKSRPKRKARATRASAAPPRRPQTVDVDDDDLEEDWFDINGNAGSDIDDKHDVSADESEDDELLESDDFEVVRRTKRKRAAAAKSRAASKRRRVGPRSRTESTRRGQSKSTPRKRPSGRRESASAPRLRFTLQQELPDPSTDEPTYANKPVVDLDPVPEDTVFEHTFVDGVPAVYVASEHEHLVSDAESGSEEYSSSASSDVAEVMLANQPNIDKHWPKCKRCNDGPTMPLYKTAHTTLKRLQKLEEKKARNKSPLRVDSRGRHREALIDDHWGKVTPVQQAQEWIEVLEDRGGWFECKTCSVSWHWGCLPLDAQKSVLRAINTEASARHRSVYGQNAPAPDPVRRIDVNGFVNTASCPDCIGYPSFCIHCKADVHGVRTVQEELGFTQAMLDEYPPPPADLTATRLFRCKRCSRSSHYECIRRASDEDDTSLDQTAKTLQDGGWLCADCNRWQAVEKIVAWRPLDRSLWNDDSNRTYAALSTRENLRREYLVKFKGKSFRDTEWVPHDWLRIVNQLMLSGFLAKGSRLELEEPELVESEHELASARKSRASLALGGGVVRAPAANRAVMRSVKKTLTVDEKGEVDFGPPSAMPDAQRRIPKAWKTPDRILAATYYGSIKKDHEDEEAGGALVDSDDVPREKLEPSDYVRSWSHVAKLYIKWQDQPYEGSTWEEPPTRRKQADIFYECQEAYRSFLVTQKTVFPALTLEERKKKQERRDARAGTRFRALDDQPLCIEGGDLIDFQLEGVNWLRYGWYNQKPGILADEMGLGKTVQIITFLASIWKEGRAGPFLVVVPNSTLPNWMREFGKWMPQFRVVPYWGESEARDMISRYEFFHSKKALAQMDEKTRAIKFHVVVAADSSVRMDSLPLRKVESWDVIIVDEGQNLKSGKSLLLKRLNELHAEHRIIMTGTPLNNNVGELFNLLNWLEPGGQWKDVKALESEYSVLKPEVIEELQKRLKPYFLRRLKREVLDLPPKVELIVPTSLRPIQKRIYRSILESNVEDIQALAASRGPGGKRNKKAALTNLNNTLMQLRKCIQHPYLIAPDLETREDEANYEATWEHQRLIDASGKLSLLQRLLPKLKAGGHRILLFSQFVINLDIVEVFLRGEGYKFLRLDGDVGQKQRQKGIDAFNAPESPYFIYMISTRAGGVGINLATADTVIIMDPDWNPHVDMQAIARAHRIGQTKKLLVFTLMCKSTAEERILEGAKRKMLLDHLIVQNLNNEEETPVELESILKFGAQALFAEGGTEESERDVRYTDKDLDSLLRRREEAEDEVFDEPAGQDGQDKGTFSYARVWEATQSAATTNAVMPTAVVDDDFWADLLQKHRDDASKRAAEAREKEAQEKRASRRDRIRNILEEEEANGKEASPEPVKRGPGRPRKVPNQTVDEDWKAAANGNSDSDDYEMIDAVLEDEEDLPAVQALRRRQIKSSNAAVAAAAAAVAKVAQSAAAGASTAAAVAASAAAAGAAAAPPAARPPVPKAPTLATTSTAAATAAAPATAAPKPKPKPKPTLPSLSGLQRELIAEHRLPRPSPLHDLDASLPIAAIRPGHLSAMRRVLLSLLHDHDFARDVAQRAAGEGAPDLPPPHMRFQLTNTHIDYYIQSFGVPRPVFEAAFSIVAEESIPPEILALPHGGAVALDWRKIRELLVRMATYMVLALRRPKNEAPWTSAIAEWAKSQTEVIEIADSPPPTRAVAGASGPPAPQTITAAASVLVSATRRQAWMEAIAARGDAELTKTAALAVCNPNSRSAPSLVMYLQSFAEGRMQRTPYAHARTSIRNCLANPRDFVDPELQPAPVAAPAPASAEPSPSKPPSKVSAALSRLSAFSGGSPRSVDVSRRDLAKLSMDIVVSNRKPRVKVARSSTSGTPRLSVGPSVAGDVESVAAESSGDEATAKVQTCIICGGDFHFLNRCPAMQDVTRASARWFQLCDQLRVLTARGLTQGDPDVATIKTTIRVMAIKLNSPRAQAGQAVLVPPFE